MSNEPGLGSIQRVQSGAKRATDCYSTGPTSTWEPGVEGTGNQHTYTTAGAGGTPTPEVPGVGGGPQ